MHSCSWHNLKADVSAWDLQSPTVRKQAQQLQNSLQEKAAIKWMHGECPWGGPGWVEVETCHWDQLVLEAWGLLQAESQWGQNVVWMEETDLVLLPGQEWVS